MVAVRVCLRLGSGPFFALLVLVLFCFVSVCVGRYAYLTGGCALLPYALLWLFLLPPFLCTVSTETCLCLVLFCWMLSTYVKDRAFERYRPHSRKKNCLCVFKETACCVFILSWKWASQDGVRLLRRNQKMLGVFDWQRGWTLSVDRQQRSETASLKTRRWKNQASEWKATMGAGLGFAQTACS